MFRPRMKFRILNQDDSRFIISVYYCRFLQIVLSKIADLFQEITDPNCLFRGVRQCQVFSFRSTRRNRTLQSSRPRYRSSGQQANISYCRLSRFVRGVVRIRVCNRFRYSIVPDRAILYIVVPSISEVSQSIESAVIVPNSRIRYRLTSSLRSKRYIRPSTSYNLVQFPDQSLVFPYISYFFVFPNRQEISISVRRGRYLIDIVQVKAFFSQRVFDIVFLIQQYRSVGLPLNP